MPVPVTVNTVGLLHRAAHGFVPSLPPELLVPPVERPPVPGGVPPVLGGLPPVAVPPLAVPPVPVPPVPPRQLPPEQVWPAVHA